MISFILDTSALLSLESVSLLETVLNNFEVITTSSVFQELEDFASYDDVLGNIAKELLKKKAKIVIEDPLLLEKLPFVSNTDNELYNLAKYKQASLITDDIKLQRHCSGKITADFSTIFFVIFVSSGLFNKTEIIEKLEQLRTIRNWQENIIYLTTREIIESLNLE